MPRILVVFSLFATFCIASQLHGQTASDAPSAPVASNETILQLPDNGSIVEDVQGGFASSALPAGEIVTAQSEPSLSPEEMFAAPLPLIASVHQTGQPPSASPPQGTVLIREARFNITVAGTFDARVVHDLIAYFDGEEIGRAREVSIARTHTFSTSTGFPPGRYRLTVRAVQPDGTNPSVPTCPVVVDYQPTYTRNMQRYCGTRCCVRQWPTAEETESD